MTIRETLERVRAITTSEGPTMITHTGVVEVDRLLDSAITELEALERDREAMEAVRDHVGCSLVDAGELFVWKNGRGPSGVGEIVRCEADPADAILGTQEAQNDAD